MFSEIETKITLFLMLNRIQRHQDISQIITKTIANDITGSEEKKVNLLCPSIFIDFYCAVDYQPN